MLDMNYLQKYKLIAAALLSLTVIFIGMAYLGSRSSRLSAAAGLIKASQEKASSLDFVVEYDETFSRTLDGNAQNYEYKIVKTKSGAQARRDVYVNGTALLESFIRNERGVFYCAPQEIISCRKLGDSGDSSRDPIGEEFEKRGIFTGIVAPRVILVGETERPARCAQYVLDLSAVSDADLKDFLNGSSVIFDGAAKALRSWVQQYEAEVCFDDETGIALTHSVKIRQTLSTPKGNIEYSSQDQVVATRMQMDPLISSEVFTDINN